MKICISKHEINDLASSGHHHSWKKFDIKKEVIFLSIATVKEKVPFLEEYCI